jgi:hypothetical protein
VKPKASRSSPKDPSPSRTPYGALAAARSSRAARPRVSRKEVRIDFFDRYPGFALLQVAWRNGGTQALEIKGWRNAAHELANAPGGFWSFSGATHEDRRDWVQPLKDGFEQRNTLSMAASDYGGGTPVANIWRRDAGLAVGHVERVPRLLDLPVLKTAHGRSIAIESLAESTLAPGQTLTTDLTFLSTHTGDHFAPLALYQKFMQDSGIVARRRRHRHSAPSGAPGVTNAISPPSRCSPRCRKCASSVSNGPCSTTAGRPTKATGISTARNSRVETPT